MLVHAIMDALLGAAALGDIGRHFPDTDPKYKGISSIKLLDHVRELLEENGYVVENIDATVIAPCEAESCPQHLSQRQKQAPSHAVPCHQSAN